ncbi:TlpA family protein disulfide reductase [Clostridium botulinum]|nr:TlpA family protein disulfide reductase [Clostridium botulinum]
MTFKIIGIVFILIIAFLILSLVVYNKDVNKRMENRRKIESIIIESETIDGKEINNEIFLDKKITIINIWGTYCSSCVKELPYLQEIYEEFQGNNLGVIGVIIDVAKENTRVKDLIKAKKILDENNIKYPNILLDSKFKACTTGAVFLIPTTIFVDRQGNVIGDIIETAYSKEEYIKIIKEILNNTVEESGNNMKKTTLNDILTHSEENYCTIDGKCEVRKK